MLALRAESSTSGSESLWKRAQLGSRFSKSVFRDDRGTAPESVRACGFKGNSSKLDSLRLSRKIRDSVLLNSRDSFLVTRPSISSKICLIYSSVIPRTHVFRDWLFLVCFCVSLETAANFHLFLIVDIFCGKHIRQ